MVKSERSFHGLSLRFTYVITWASVIVDLFLYLTIGHKGYDLFIADQSVAVMSTVWFCFVFREVLTMKAANHGLLCVFLFPSEASLCRSRRSSFSSYVLPQAKSGISSDRDRVYLIAQLKQYCHISEIWHHICLSGRSKNITPQLSSEITYWLPSWYITIVQCFLNHFLIFLPFWTTWSVVNNKVETNTQWVQVCYAGAVTEARDYLWHHKNMEAILAHFKESSLNSDYIHVHDI